MVICSRPPAETILVAVSMTWSREMVPHGLRRVEAVPVVFAAEAR
jgi:hypothetical protein